MLAKENRIVSAADFRNVMRKGRRTISPALNVSVIKVGNETTRFGYIITKVVGNAVTRNRVRRRLQNLSAEFIAAHPTGFNVVVRGLAGAEELTSDELRVQMNKALNRSL